MKSLFVPKLQGSWRCCLATAGLATLVGEAHHNSRSIPFTVCTLAIYTLVQLLRFKRHSDDDLG